jgi:hypothetical protein
MQLSETNTGRPSLIRILTTLVSKPLVSEKLNLTLAMQLRGNKAATAGKPRNDKLGQGRRLADGTTRDQVQYGLEPDTSGHNLSWCYAGLE